VGSRRRLRTQSTAPGGASINVRDWDFGDGSTHSAAQNPSHTYSAGGSYVVKLTVTDSNGTVSNPVQHTVTVSSSDRRRRRRRNDDGVVRLGPMPVGTGSNPQPHSESFNLISGSTSPSNIVKQIAYCQKNDKTMKIIMAGGDHQQYIDQTTHKFDLQLWKNKIDKFDDPNDATSSGRDAIRAAIASGVETGNIMGHDMMDEPGNDTAAKGWGGVMTRALLDKMADYSKGKWPTMPAGFWGAWDDHLPGDPAVFQSVDFQIPSFVWRHIGFTRTIDDWITDAKAYFDAQGLAHVFAMNPLNGGYKPSMWDSGSNPQYPSPYPTIFDETTKTCFVPPTGGNPTGEHQPGSTANCAMTDSQYQTYAIALLNAGDALCVWRWDSEYMARSTTIAAEVAIRAVADTLSRPRWSRRT
jgi:PKD repeat protein